MATRNAWAAALLLLVIPGLAAQQGVPEQPSYKTGVEVVTVDVGVIDRQGQPVRGLATNDFTVTVAGQPRRVVSAEYVEHASVQRLMSAGRDIVPVSSNEGQGGSAASSCSSSIRARSSPAARGRWSAPRRASSIA